MREILFLITLIKFFSCLGSPGLAMTLENNKNFPPFMLVGGPSASVTYDIVNTTGGNAAIRQSDLSLATLPKSSTIILEQPNKQSCDILPNNGICKLTITLNPTTEAAIQDIYQTGPEFELSVMPGFKQPLYPIKAQQITVRVFPDWRD